MGQRVGYKHTDIKSAETNSSRQFEENLNKKIEEELKAQSKTFLVESSVKFHQLTKLSALEPVTHTTVEEPTRSALIIVV
jgi:hypothetical protein